jgi:hypothetical protein
VTILPLRPFLEHLMGIIDSYRCWAVSGDLWAMGGYTWGEEDVHAMHSLLTTCVRRPSKSLLAECSRVLPLAAPLTFCPTC